MGRRTSLVTGGTGGLGLGVVRALLERGDQVWIPWIEQAEMQRLQASIGDGHNLRMIEADVMAPERLAALRARLETEVGHLDVLCNLVGGFTMAPIQDTTDEAWSRMMRLNAESVFRVTRAMTGLLEASERGRIVNVAAAAAIRGGGAGMTAYAASKGAVVALTQALAAELGPGGVSVNAVAPTIIDTPPNRAAMPDADRSGWVTPAEIGSLITFLTGDDARVISGNVILTGR